MTELDKMEDFARRFLYLPTSIEPMPQFPQSDLAEFAEGVRFEWEPAGEISLNSYQEHLDPTISWLTRTHEGLEPVWMGATNIRVGPRVAWERNEAPRNHVVYKQLGGVALFQRLNDEELAFRREFMYSPMSAYEIAELKPEQIVVFLALCTRLGYKEQFSIYLPSNSRTGELSIRALIRGVGKDNKEMARKGLVAGPRIIRDTTTQENRQMLGLRLYEKIQPTIRTTTTPWLRQLG